MPLSRAGRLLAFGALATALGFGIAQKPVSASAPAALRRQAIELAVITTPPGPDATASDVRIVTIDEQGTRDVRMATIAHAAGAVLRGDVLRGERAVVVAADVDGLGSARDWTSALFRVEPGAARVLARGLYHASRPLASSDGRVYVQRGTAGATPTADDAKAGRLRTDMLTIDAVDPKSGAAQTIYAWSGYTLHVAGEWKDEIVLYRVAYEGAELVGVARTTGKSRRIASLLPFARDFSIDEARGAIVMSNRDDVDPHVWILDRVDLASGLRTRLAQQRDETPAAFALASGDLARSAPAGRALMVASRTLAPLGAGFYASTHASPDGAWMTVRHVKNGVEVLAAVHVGSGTAKSVVYGDAHVEALGFFGATRGGVR